MQTRVADGTGPVAVPEGGPALPPRISWGAVIAGAVVAVAVGLTLNILGAAVGASVVDLTGRTRPMPRASASSAASGCWSPT